jgi:hypothetical protein
MAPYTCSRLKVGKSERIASGDCPPLTPARRNQPAHDSPQGRSHRRVAQRNPDPWVPPPLSLTHRDGSQDSPDRALVTVTRHSFTHGTRQLRQVLKLHCVQIERDPARCSAARSARISDLVVVPSPQSKRHALIFLGSDARNPATEGDTLWVRKSPSLSSSHSMGF